MSELSGQQKESAVNDFVSPEDQDRFGLHVRESAGHLEAYYHAGGKDNIVASEQLTDKAKPAQLNLDQVLQNQMSDLEKVYNVKFATPGEEVQRQIIREPDCTRSYGDMIHAKTPTFADLYATREALQHSLPSQLTRDGNSGVKIYFMDKSIFTQPAYGNKPALAVYIDADKDDKIAMLVTPDGEKLAPTAKDTDDPKARNLSYVIEHELTHNSQHNSWSNYPEEPSSLAESYGWKATWHVDWGHLRPYDTFELKGKDGLLFVNTPPTCGADTAWLAEKNDKWQADNGKSTDDIKAARHFTNDQVQADAEVRPVTYYFPNPVEMLSEGLTNYRTDRENRARLFHESPALYAAAKKYDGEEIDRHYGLDKNGQSKFVRTPDGLVAPRTPQTVAKISAFEKGLANPGIATK